MKGQISYQQQHIPPCCVFNLRDLRTFLSALIGPILHLVGRVLPKLRHRAGLQGRFMHILFEISKRKKKKKKNRTEQFAGMNIKREVRVN